MFAEQLIRRQFSGIELLKRKLYWKNPAIWFVCFYLMHFISFIYTDNMDFALMDVGMKASFIVFPLFFLFFQPRVNWKVTTTIFIIAVFISIALNLILSIDKYIATNIHHYLFGERLSHFMHRGYWSIYLTIAYVLLWANTIKTNPAKPFKYVGLLIILVSIFMTASKIGILLSLIVTLYFLYQLALPIKRKIYLAGIILMLVGGLFIANRVIPQLSSRIARTTDNMFTPIEEMNKENIQSTTARILMWDTAIDLIEENFWFGVGSGDVKDELQELNYKKGYIAVADKNLNSHNQFLNSHVAVGLFGLIFLLLAYLLAISIKKRKQRATQNWIIFILFMAALPEAFLETQAGIVPVAFVLILLGYRNRLSDLNLLRSPHMK